jgi:tRNA A37 methylthiotransferase MiaB
MALQLPSPPKVGMVSLGCPKNLVDSERILTKLRSDGYQMSPDYDQADVVLVNTCGFLDSAKEESLAAIGEASPRTAASSSPAAWATRPRSSAPGSRRCSPSLPASI